jgi:tellurite resistance protein TerC
MHVPLSMWAVFAGIVAVSLVVDLLSHRGEHGTSRGAAIAWSVAWIAVALGFCGWIALRLGRGPAEDFLTAYLMEKSLSVDNLFVFLLVFGQLKMKPAEQHRVLFWGILGALVFRGLFIAAGTAVLQRWHEVVYILGAFLVFTGLRTLRAHGTEKDEGGVMKFVRERLHLKSTFVLAIVTIELTDIMFAIDSVPAVFAISSDPFIVYTSNVFAILGLRALYLVLSDLLGRLRYMHYGLSAILILAGTKMLTSGFFHVPHVVSLAAIGVIMSVTIIASLLQRP